jgi:hypothetical protein
MAEDGPERTLWCRSDEFLAIIVTRTKETARTIIILTTMTIGKLEMCIEILIDWNKPSILPMPNKIWHITSDSKHSIL